jgi:diphthamide biosynthesis protein 2
MVEDIEDFFEIERCIRWVNENSFERVAMQFPDDLLKYSYEITSIIERKSRAKIFILADTSYKK